eukprot:CAMPEP_0197030642 /NCGR_PEP_ID=MMETSP1384-20130603/9835_1 /TAXON_ID=29189 /ORGANISM="Ammonia sp." /LENGTH=415 /DNA_ID=CAMNT_0042460029 /DNA_START=30 /DNA_END=1277 /DNA_ORIENTATION=+
MWSFLAVFLFSATAFARWGQKNLFEGHNPWSKIPGVQLNADGAPIPQCHMTPAFPPPADRKLTEFVIDLDEDAKTRWNAPTLQFKDGINNMLQLVTGSDSVQEIVKYFDKDMDEYLALFPKDWGDEIRGLATTLDADVGDVFLYNIAYEIFGLCTSIVTQDETGHLYHGRNLDFGLWPAVNWTTVQWELTDALRDILFNVNFTKNGELLYRSTVFGGYIGLLTGVRKGAMSISVDTRFDENHDKYLMEYLKNPTASMQWLSLTTRQAIEDYSSYSDAISFMKQTAFIGPCYVIIGGVNKNEGSVLSIGPNMTLWDQWTIPEAQPQNNTAQPPFYVLETNYDHWEPPPPFDDRRYPAEMCMDEIGSKGMGWYTLYNVLNGIPNRNRLTTYTTLMDTESGDLVAWKQYCDVTECIPW